MARRIPEIEHDIIALNSTDTTKVEEAYSRLVNDGEHGIELIIAASSDENSIVRCRAAMLLGEIGGSKSVSQLIHMTRDPDANVQYDAVRALGRAGDPTAIDRLLEILARSAEREAIRGIAGVSLSELGASSLDGLIRLAESSPKHIRSVALTAIGRVEGVTAFQALAKHVHDPDEDIRIVVCEALALMHRPDARSEVESMTADSSAAVRESATYWLAQTAHKADSH